MIPKIEFFDEKKPQPTFTLCFKHLTRLNHDGENTHS